MIRQTILRPGGAFCDLPPEPRRVDSPGSPLGTFNTGAEIKAAGIFRAPRLSRDKKSFAGKRGSYRCLVVQLLV